MSDKRFVSIQSTLIKRGIIKKPSQSTQATGSSRAQPAKASSSFSIANHKEARNVVKHILEEVPCNYTLLPYNKFKASNLRRSDAYDHYHVLVAKNSKANVGWLVCNYVLSGHCSVEEGTKRFCTTQGTSQLLRHISKHKEKCEEPTLHVLSKDEKKIINEAAAKAATMDTMPLSFCYHKPGFLILARALIEIGQRHPVSASLDVKDALPCANTVRNTISSMASLLRHKIREELMPLMIKAGGGISCDGVKVEETGKKYYDFVVHFIEIGRTDPATRKKTWAIKKKVLFVARCNGSETADALRNLIDESLGQFSTSVDILKGSFTFVTDCAATMAAIFGASVSPNRVPFSELWIGCISHQLNTAMKHAVENCNDPGFKADLECLKKLVTVFKKSGLNEKLPSGKALMQEVPTRFGTTFDMVKRFVEGSPYVVQTIEAAEQESSSKASDLLDAIQVSDGVYISFEAIVKCFAPIRHAQTTLECVSSPTLTMVLPIIQQIKTSLSFTQRGIQQADSSTPISSIAQTLAQHTLNAMDRINMHDLWVAACLIHPGLRSLSFFTDVCLRNEARAKGMSLLRKMVDNISHANNSHSTDTKQDNLTPCGGDLGKSAFHLSSCMSFLGHVTEEDDLSRYMSCAVTMADRELLQANDGIVDYWLSKRDEFPTVYQVAMRILATPASSTSSERDFSLLKLGVSKHRCNSKDDIIDDKAVLQSHLCDIHKCN